MKESRGDAGSSEMSRRDFLGLMATGVAALMIPGCGANSRKITVDSFLRDSYENVNPDYMDLNPRYIDSNLEEVMEDHGDFIKERLGYVDLSKKEDVRFVIGYREVIGAAQTYHDIDTNNLTGDQAKYLRQYDARESIGEDMRDLGGLAPWIDMEKMGIKDKIFLEELFDKINFLGALGGS